MSWPAPDEYNQAIQNPAVALADPELQKGIPELSSLGLPKPITGNFASVYKMETEAGVFAVRCFLRHFRDQQERYAAISRKLQRAGLPALTKVHYIPKGILVGASWYPILKMKWVEGVTLDRYVAEHLREPKLLRELAGRFVTVVQALQQQQIAHGDLQHGNILVSGGRLRLVDYDGMYVPALRGKGSHELGHPNYQHPGRNEQHFGPFLDHFSAWVIYTSLIVLSLDRGLWELNSDNADGNMDSLLFTKKDFSHLSSPLWQALTRHHNPEVRKVSSALRSLCQAEHIEKITPLRAKVPKAPVVVRMERPAAEEAAPVLKSKVGRNVTIGVAGGVCAFLLFGMPGTALLLALGACGTKLGVSYWRWPRFTQRRQLQRDLARVKKDLTAAEKALRLEKKECERTITPVEKWVAQLQARHVELNQRQTAQAAKIEQWANKRLRDLATEREKASNILETLKARAHSTLVRTELEWKRQVTEMSYRVQSDTLDRRLTAARQQLALLKEECDQQVEAAQKELLARQAEVEKAEREVQNTNRATFQTYLQEKLRGKLRRFGPTAHPPVHYHGSYQVTRHVNSRPAHIKDPIDTND